MNNLPVRDMGGLLFLWEGRVAMDGDENDGKIPGSRQQALDRDDPCLLGAILRALAFASRKHREQRRKDGASPYINHPIDLANLLVNEAGVREPDVVMAALLHDTIEDTATTREELEDAFGAVVTRIVLEVSDDKSLPKEERKRLQVAHAASLSREAKLVKLADKICNLRDLTAHPPVSWSPARRLAYVEWAREVGQGLRGVHPHLESLLDAACSAPP